MNITQRIKRLEEATQENLKESYVGDYKEVHLQIKNTLSQLEILTNTINSVNLEDPDLVKALERIKKTKILITSLKTLVRFGRMFQK